MVPTRRSAAPTEAPVDEIDWTDCTTQIDELIPDDAEGAGRDLTFECGRTDVPIDYDDPTGDTLPLFLVRATLGEQTDRIGSLLVNPGGPGGSGADFAIGQALTMPADVLERFQVVGFDPRGVGLSTPVECIPSDVKAEMFAAEPRPTSAADIDAAFELADRVATGCEDEYGDALGIFNTVDTARDMDRLREALGDEKLTYLGYSYGTTLGSTYAELFPDKVRAMVLDGATDPDADPVADAEGQAAGFEDAFDAFAKGCKAFRAGCPMGDDPRLYLEKLLDEAEAEPIPTDEDGDDREATAGDVFTAVVAALYDQDAWPQLSQALVAARKGNAAGVFTLADSYTGRLDDGTYSNLFDANYAINCADTAEEEQVPEEEIRSLVAEWSEEYPLFGAQLRHRTAQLQRLGRPADAAAGARRRGQPADPGHRHRGRPGHAAGGGGRHGRGPAERRPADLAGRGPHGVPEDQVRHRGGGRLPPRGEGAEGRPHLSGVRRGAQGGRCGRN